MTFNVAHSVIRDRAGKIKFRRFSRGGRDHYHIGVWIDEENRFLDSVDRVEYRLHSSFQRPIRTSSSRSNKFSITFWTWGYFDINICVFFLDGRTDRSTYHLHYDLPEDTAENYVMVGDESL